MKRFVWLLLIAFCTALGQVQPVAAPQTKQAACDCCEDQAGACGMPDCIPQPAASQPVAVQAAAAQHAETRKLTRAKRVDFYVQSQLRLALKPVATAAVTTAPAASVPLYQAHCSFLI